jgi:predicted PurR-regulated permease PerM
VSFSSLLIQNVEVMRMPRTTKLPHSLRGEIIFAFALALACYLAWLVRDILVLLYVSALFAVVISPVVRSIADFQVRRWKPFKNVAIFVLLATFVGSIVIFGFLALPPVVRDLEEFSREAPARLPAFISQLQHLPFAEKINMDQFSSRIQDFGSNAATYLLLSIRDWSSNLFHLIMGCVLTVYFILEGDQAYRWFLSFVPIEERGRLDATLQRARVRMDKWLVGQGSLMLILGVVSTIVYVSLHIRYAYALGVLTGLLNIVPVLGAAVCVALTLLVAAIDSWGRVLGIAIFYAIYLQIENSYLIPRIMKSSVDLPGLAILVALLLGSELQGVLGVLVSVPTAVLVAVLLDEYLVKSSIPRDSPEPIAIEQESDAGR